MRTPTAVLRGQVRLIGGQWKRTRLDVPSVPGLRPTPDRVRETLFNWLGQDLTGWRCADVFAGTGALGLEAASRGATAVVLVEQHAQLARALQGHVQRLGARGVEVMQADALRWMRHTPSPAWDVVFLDPPFGDASNHWNRDLFVQVIQLASSVVAPGGWVYLESAQDWSVEAPQQVSWRLHRHIRAGAVHAHLFQALPLHRASSDNAAHERDPI